MKTQVQLVASNEPFFTGDSSTDTAQLLIGGQPVFEPSQVYISAMRRADWQGNQLLYAFARSNLCPNPETVGGTGWTNISCTVTLNALPSPSGSVTGVSLIKATSGTTAYTPSPAITLVAGQPYYTVNVFIQYSNSVVSGISVYNSGITTSIATQNVTWNASTGVPALNAPGGSVAKTSVLTSMGNGIYKLTMFVNTGSTAAIKVLTYPDRNNSGAACYFWGVDVRAGLVLDSYLTNPPSTVTPVTDYTATVDQIAFGQVPALNAAFAWSGTATGEQLTAAPTLLAQYGTSPVLAQLVDFDNQALDPSIDLDTFYDYVWNVDTAQGFGLNMWGAIVNVPRTIILLPATTFFGFDEALPGSYPFNQEPFYNGPQQGSLYELSDPAYRILIMTKALANISSFTAPSVNALLQYLFAGRGSCYVLELSTMQIEYVFNFALEPWEASILQQPALMPRPAGVGVTIVVNP